VKRGKKRDRKRKTVLLPPRRSGRLIIQPEVYVKPDLEDLAHAFVEAARERVKREKTRREGSSKDT
jgi:hypothetical protein